MNSFVDDNRFIELLQSGFRAHHSTVSALFKVTNDLHLSIDSGDWAIVILLDLGTAFNKVDAKFNKTEIVLFCPHDNSKIASSNKVLSPCTFHRSS